MYPTNVINVNKMFADSKFNQDISNWVFGKIIYFNGIFDNCPIKDEFKPLGLIKFKF